MSKYTCLFSSIKKLHSLTLLHPEWPKLHRVLAVLSATGLRKKYKQWVLICLEQRKHMYIFHQYYFFSPLEISCPNNIYNNAYHIYLIWCVDTLSGGTTLPFSFVLLINVVERRILLKQTISSTGASSLKVELFFGGALSSREAKRVTKIVSL